MGVEVDNLSEAHRHYQHDMMSLRDAVRYKGKLPMYGTREQARPGPENVHKAAMAFWGFVIVKISKHKRGHLRSTPSLKLAVID